MNDQPRRTTGEYAAYTHAEPSLTLGAAAAAWPGITYEVTGPFRGVG